MNRGNHVVAVDVTGKEPGHDEMLLTEEVGSSTAETRTPDFDPRYADWDAEESAPKPARALFAPALAGMAVLAWTGTFAWSKRAAFASPPTLDEGLSWFGTWSGPVLLICVVWLLVMRTSRREAARFNDAAQLLGIESERLSARLTATNSELSLAREFIAAQARDLESLGRLATERLSQNAETLQSLIKENSDQIEAIGTVSAAALDNMEKLRGQLPVIANAARDVTNNIGNAGRTAQAQVQEMITGFKRINEFGQASERQVTTLSTRADETMTGLLDQSAKLEELTERRFGEVVERADAVRRELEEDQAKAIESLSARIAALAEGSAELAEKLSQAENSSATALSERLAQIDDEISERQTSQLERFRKIEHHGDAVARQISEFEGKLDSVSALASDTEERISASLAGLEERLAAGRVLVSETDGEIAGLTDSSVRLLEIIQAGSQHSREHLPLALSEAELRLGSVETRIKAMRMLTEETASLGDNLMQAIGNTHEELATAAQGIDALHGRIGEQSDAQSKAIAALQAAIEEVARNSSDLTGKLENELTEALGRIVEDRGTALAAQIELATTRASEVSRETTIQLRDQLARVDELAGNLERRVAHARERAEERVENDFSRRVALITESLNSHAIDITRNLGSDVSDIAWSAYLKGDRGIFTRRAVTLLQAGESKAVMQAYENDPELQAHVNRYIHDFEAMLRQVLSTRDGDALGITLLSSDMGKLYVALAQAIERLRR